MQSPKFDKYKAFVAEIKLFEEYFENVDKNAKIALKKRYLNVKNTIKNFEKFIYVNYFKEVCDNNDFIFSNQTPTKNEYFKLKATTKGLEYYYIAGGYDRLLFTVRFVRRYQINYIVIKINAPQNLSVETKELLNKVFSEKYGTKDFNYLSQIYIKLEDEIQPFNLSNFFSAFSNSKISSDKIRQFNNNNLKDVIIQKINNLINYTSNNSIQQALQLLGYKNV